MANAPDFNPNAYRDARARSCAAIARCRTSTSRDRRSRSSSPARRSKSEPRRRAPSSMPSAGNIRFGSRVINDDHNYGVLSFAQTIIEVEQRRRDQGGAEARAREGQRLRAPVWLRPADVAGFPRREPGHRVGPVVAHRQRVGLGGDGLPGRRHAAPDGGCRQRRRQRRQLVQPRVVRAVIRDRSGRPCRARFSSGSITASTAATLTQIMEGVVTERHRQSGANSRATPWPERPAPPRSWSTAATAATPTTTCRSSGLCLAQAGVRDRRRRRFAASRLSIWRCRRGADLPEDRRNRAAPLQRSAIDRCARAAARVASRRHGGAAGVWTDRTAAHPRRSAGRGPHHRISRSHRHERSRRAASRSRSSG